MWFPVDWLHIPLYILYQDILLCILCLDNYTILYVLHLDSPLHLGGHSHSPIIHSRGVYHYRMKIIYEEIQKDSQWKILILKRASLICRSFTLSKLITFGHTLQIGKHEYDI